MLRSAALQRPPLRSSAAHCLPALHAALEDWDESVRLHAMRSLLRIADARFRNGATSELDVSQARALLDSTQASIPQVEIGLAQSKNALTTLLGQPTGSLLNVLRGPQPIPMAPAQVAVSIPAEVLRRRPDIRKAELVAMAQSERIGKWRHTKSSARTGVRKTTSRRWLAELGWIWTPTMQIGSGCKVHLRAEELPQGRLIVSVSRHLVAVIDGVIHDFTLARRRRTVK